MGDLKRMEDAKPTKVPATHSIILPTTKEDVHKDDQQLSDNKAEQLRSDLMSVSCGGCQSRHTLICHMSSAYCSKQRPSPQKKH
ncbi:hypothetical protein N7466_010150 [Penicillium verhagenii]|uniref:uncharacterized protein n=1 Tax=Penicillium verhagenii TaxID=1562060 RepID=UPI002544EA3E|nr:uncharacterized protein N7466_010150 [Penicillium verhagenii]KAJ5919207.1 hypothetical protein N7466_010150 [Penicillium verhagenii]